jgi:uncharacterized protein (TIGR03435 family)
MTELDDHELLAAYARHHSETAFAALVARHVSLVHSAALRFTSDPQQAEEITQAVFIILARKAGSLRGGVVLSGWLYQTARLTAANLVKGEIRRQRREQEACMQTTVNEEDESAWEQIAPLLDEAMGRLGETDRNAVVLRYFENKTAAEIGARLKLKEAAAHKRVTRSLEKLRKFFTQRGVVLAATAIAGAVSANSVQAAPAGLAQTISTVALAKGAAAGGSTLTLVKGALKIMAWTKAKVIVMTSVALVLTAGTTTVAVKEIDSHRVYDWQKRWDFSMMAKVPPQVAIRRALPGRSASVDGNSATSHGKIMGLGFDFSGMVRSIYEIDQEHLIVSAPVPPGKFDYLANLPGDWWVPPLQQEIRRQFGLTVRGMHVMTNALPLTVRSPHAPGLKPYPDPNQWGPQLTKNSFSGHGGVWMLVQFLEDSLGTVVVDRTGLTNHFDMTLKWDGTPEGLKQALRDQLGLELGSGDQPTAVNMFVVEKATKPSWQTLTQIADVQPDGSVHFQITIAQTNRTGGILQNDYITGSPTLDTITDESGAPLEFTAQQNGLENVVIVTLNHPVPPGGGFAYTVGLTVTNLAQPTAETGAFLYQVQDCPDDHCITHCIEEYRLPPGAVVLARHPADLKESTSAGRVALRVDRLLPPAGIRSTDFRYRLAAAN